MAETSTPIDELGDWCRGWRSPTPGFMQRASHVLIDREGIAWIIDPVESPLLDAALNGHTPGGVIQLMERHNRDSEAVAVRLGVPYLRVPQIGNGTPFTVIPVVRQPRFGWVEVALWWPERAALVVADALGTSPYHRVGDNPVGVHPVLRANPPRMLQGHPARHLLCGHGEGVHGPETANHINTAIDGARRGIVDLAAKGAREAAGGVVRVARGIARRVPRP